ncbi:DNA polymerase III subunit psi [Vibrio sp. ZSDE26]|uniref:DNA polymerase III subunit psi n=1 Tax=Vibrio amylolyticus TaxID=2847292 RepID=A0A9X2BJ50_9VIBR|nr:DNA polymerase III subunit psi [Vibrio amylolyticus]MCK6264845.1 DNA polymerase III subunit psi [Vibrio amylolyticus]
MAHTELQYLQEMGIDAWQLSHPERLQGFQVARFNLPTTCQLLLVSNELPTGELAVMFERVLKSIKLEIDQAQHVYPEQLSALGEHNIAWVWYAGEDAQMSETLSTKKLTTPLLSSINGHNEHRRALWQQICSYE